MIKQKKDRSPAKGNGLIGNRLHGNSKLHKGRTVCNAIRDGRNMGYLLQNIKSGLTAYLKVFRALEAKYIPFLDSDFRDSFYKTLRGEHAE